MKPYIHILILAVTLLSSTFNTICSQTIKEQLIGTWTFDYEQTKSEIDLDTKEQQTSQSEALYKGRTITFETGGKYTLSLSDGRDSTGQWVTDENEKIVTITFPIPDEEDVVEVLQILKLKANKLTLKPMRKSHIKALYPKQHYTKNQNN